MKTCLIFAQEELIPAFSTHSFVALTLLAMCLRFGKVLFSDDACSQLLHLIFKKLFSAQRSTSARSIRQVPVQQSSFGIRLHPTNSTVFNNFGCFDWYEKWLETLRNKKKICVLVSPVLQKNNWHRLLNFKVGLILFYFLEILVMGKTPSLNLVNYLKFLNPIWRFSFVLRIFLQNPRKWRM